jgi:formylglycine-generating enzyme required for sulfatase activity
VNAPSAAKSALGGRKAIWAVPLLLLAIGGGAAVWWVTRSKPPVAIPAAREQPAPVPTILGMIYIPAGTFLSGPQNTPVSLPAFYIDETEVSNADFAEYCQVARCPAPDGAADLPVVNVTIAQARAFAAWKGKQLPTASEWERAARGTAGNKYPWGPAEDPSLANVSTRALKPVKSYAAYPEYQMAGNAWEMVESEIKPSRQQVASFAKRLKPAPTIDEKWIEIRGGSFNTPLAFAVGYEWSPIPERYFSADIGFRCAKSAP